MQKKIKYDKIKLFIDFDGTITKKDIGNDFFRFLLGAEKFNYFYNQLLTKSVTIKKYWELLFDELTFTLLPNSNNDLFDNNNTENYFDILNNQKNIKLYLENCEIDDYFKTFLNYLDTIDLNLNPIIVSDGFDIYIDKILQLNKIDIAVECNSVIIKDNKLFPKFKMESESCNCFSANCKRNLILKDYIENDLIVYIGDGISDFCPAEYCDVIFAKGQLAQYCNQNNIPHHNFNNFFDVISIFKRYFTNNTKQIKIRNQAFIKRKLAFEIE
ncbi:MAG: HAD-IB family phosphatase [Candidatus Kapaibacteriota bacterium]|jgi:2-hydroxy-3-keto-5-methylthiopentenyl-1-phosphate phosphatase